MQFMLCLLLFSPQILLCIHTLTRTHSQTQVMRIELKLVAFLSIHHRITWYPCSKNCLQLCFRDVICCWLLFILFQYVGSRYKAWFCVLTFFAFSLSLCFFGEPITVWQDLRLRTRTPNQQQPTNFIQNKWKVTNCLSIIFIFFSLFCLLCSFSFCCWLLYI